VQDRVSSPAKTDVLSTVLHNSTRSKQAHNSQVTLLLSSAYFSVKEPTKRKGKLNGIGKKGDREERPGRQARGVEGKGKRERHWRRFHISTFFPLQALHALHRGSNFCLCKQWTAA